MALSFSTLAVPLFAAAPSLAAFLGGVLVLPGSATAAGALPRAARIDGVVVDELGETVAGASVLVTPNERNARDSVPPSATTDARGAFALELPPGLARIAVFKNGFNAALFEEMLADGERRAVRYRLAHGELSASIVATRLLPRLPAPDREVSRYVVNRADLDRSPGAMEDVARVIANLPGVVADPDLLATFFVRGGGPEEVVAYLDGVPLQNPFHLGGFASVFNPMLIDTVDFSAGVTPPRYEPSLSGALDVHYVTGQTQRLRAEADLSMQTAKVRVETPTGVKGLSALGAFRRSFFELYFAGLRAAHVVSGDYVAPDLTEGFVRLNYERGIHRITLSYMRATDGFSFLLKPDEQPLFGATRGLVLSNQLQLGLLQDRLALDGSRELTLTAALTGNKNLTSVARESVLARDARSFGALARADLLLPFAGHRLVVGGQVAGRSYNLHGQLPDERGVAPWASRPLVETYAQPLTIRPRLRQDNVAVYVELLTRPVPWLSLESGARTQARLSGGTAVYTVRAAGTAELPTGTLLKLEAGIATQQPLNPLLLDATYGNPALLPERSRQLVIGVEQLLPNQVLFRVEGFSKWLDRLAVNPDSDGGVRALLAAGQPVFESVGAGTTRGVDLLVLGRAENISYGFSGGLVFANRTNPLATGVRAYAAPWDQRLTLSANASMSAGTSWIMSARATFHTGRPYTPVIGFGSDVARQRYLPIFGATNSARYSNYFDTSLRVEKRFGLGALSLAWYAEILNLTNARNLFALAYDEGHFAAGAEPTQGTFDHLPIRPFVGVRGEY